MGLAEVFFLLPKDLLCPFQLPFPGRWFLGYHPNFCLVFDGSPRMMSTFVGLEYAGFNGVGPAKFRIPSHSSALSVPSETWPGMRIIQIFGDCTSLKDHCKAFWNRRVRRRLNKGGERWDIRYPRRSKQGKNQYVFYLFSDHLSSFLHLYLENWDIFFIIKIQ